jgi:hypothetical protein
VPLKVESEGSFTNTQSFLQRCMEGPITPAVLRMAEAGVQALKAATPQDSGITASSWSYEVVDEGGKQTIWFSNSNVVDGFNVAVGLQYGHGTNNGGWVPGTDYINPVLEPIFDKMADAAWKEVNRA